MLRCALVLLVLFAIVPKVAAQEVAPTAAECEVATAAILGQMIPPAVTGLLGSWFGVTAEMLGLPDGCERPYLPLETPYCYEDQGRSWCADHLMIVHLGDPGQEFFCYRIVVPTSLSGRPSASSTISPDWYCTYPPV